MTPELTQSISQLIPDGNRLNLPADQLTNYPAVKKCLLAAGGKYNRGGFDFPECATQLQERLVVGEAINDVKKFQFFPTPTDLAAHMIVLADIGEGMRCLEPSAGQGAIFLPMIQAAGKANCHAIELMPQNCKALGAKGLFAVEADFLSITESDCGLFDRIVANPPFTRNQDIDHVLHMWELLKPSGRIVTLMSPHHTFAESSKVVAFRSWLEEVGAQSMPIAAGTFKEQGTNVATVLVVIDKSAA